MKNKVFLSYSLDNLDYARALAEKLKAVGIDVWFDREEIVSGESIVEAYENALKTASIIIILLSKDYNNSQWTAFERGAAHALNKEILPIILDDTYNIPADIAGISILNAKNMDANKVIQRIQEALVK